MSGFKTYEVFSNEFATRLEITDGNSPDSVGSKDDGCHNEPRPLPLNRKMAKAREIMGRFHNTLRELGN